MEQLFGTVAIVIAGAGLVVGALGAALTRSLLAIFPLTLDLWTAAALLQVAGGRSWLDLAMLATLLAVRAAIRYVLFGRQRVGGTAAPTRS